MDAKEKISLDLPASAIMHPLSPALDGDEGLIIRPLALTDAPHISAAISASLPDLRRFMPWAHSPQTADVQRRRIASSIHAYWLARDYALGIFGSRSGRFPGGTGLHCQRTLNPLGLEIGYWIHSANAGKGLATLATRCLIAYGFAYLRLARIQCAHDAKNTASARVGEKCGFRVEGRLRRFDREPTEEMRSNGWQGTGEIVLRGLCPEDIPDLPWYEEALNSLTVLDWLGHEVPRPPSTATSR